MGEKSLTTEEIAKRLKVSKLTVYDLIKKEVIPSYRVGRQVRVDEEDLLEYIERRKHGRVPERKPVTQSYQVSNEEIPGTLVVNGQDISLDILVRYLSGKLTNRQVLRSHVGSLSSLIDLYRETEGIASVHLYDGDTDTYNIPYVKKILVGLPCVVFHFLIREVGFYVKKGNPKNITRWEDLKRKDVRFVNRERGAGIRVLVDEKLRLSRILPSEVDGYEHIAQNHTGVAAAVASDQADVGVGMKSIALLTNLTFIPLQREHYDLVILKKENYQELIGRVKTVLADEKFRMELALVGDYDLTHLGEIAYETP